MAKEHKKRGRRGGEKRKQDDLDEVADLVDHSSKRCKSATDGDAPATESDNLLQQESEIEDTLDTAYPPALERPFFGMLDDEEQEYFRHADATLEENNFADVEERKLFLADVYKQAEGKELKIAQSQSCSRLMERLIQVWDAELLKGLFAKFAGQYGCSLPSLLVDG